MYMPIGISFYRKTSVCCIYRYINLPWKVIIIDWWLFLRYIFCIRSKNNSRASVIEIGFISLPLSFLKIISYTYDSFYLLQRWIWVRILLNSRNQEMISFKFTGSKWNEKPETTAVSGFSVLVSFSAHIVVKMLRKRCQWKILMKTWTRKKLVANRAVVRAHLKTSRCNTAWLFAERRSKAGFAPTMEGVVTLDALLNRQKNTPKIWFS